MVLSSKGYVLTGFSCLSALIFPPPVTAGCKKTSVQCCSLKGLQQITTKLVGEGCKKYASKKPQATGRKDLGLVPTALQIHVWYSCKVGCGGLSPHLTDDSALCWVPQHTPGKQW